MCKVKHLAMIGGLAWTLLVGMRSQAQAQTNGVAAVSIRNLTRVTVRYAFWWGDDGEVSRIILGPGQGWYHYYLLDDDGLAPMPHIGFDIGGATYWQQYTLEFYTNTAPVYGFRRGKPYYFSYTGIGTLDLFSRPY